METAVVWFRNDLRTHDNHVLQVALEKSRHVVAVFISPKEKPFRGINRYGKHRKQFFTETVDELFRNLQALDIELTCVSSSNDLLDHLQRLPDPIVYTARQHCIEESSETAFIANHVKVEELDNETLYAFEALPFPLKKLKTFTPFRHKVEKKAEVQSEAKDDSPIDHVPMKLFKGGESFGLARLRYYLWDSDLISTYKETRNGSLGTDFSSHLSPWLANGSISPRRVWNEVLRYEQEKGGNESTYWLRFELLWREFFRWNALKTGNGLFVPDGITGTPNTGYRSDSKAFELWTEGRTGQPFVDAHMRMLNRTGFMSNRGRQNAASYWVHDMKGDWLTGAAWFEHQLIDYDAVSNYGNWAYIAGVGADPRGGRKFNVDQQMEWYDPDGLFIQSQL